MYSNRFLTKCPICSKTMTHCESFYHMPPIIENKCSNNCVMIYSDGVDNFILIFGQMEQVADCYDNLCIEDCKETIKYWKENDRFLVEIIGEKNENNSV